ncbi:protein phosphatase 2C-related protein [Heterostelium album PN500]|uniref:Protein phosphatase 2C-related protein n=1 Tax=Heterostelium pallidum (strain ATCC 26659 / Pp 5 / PN500) TaxID=670386 RepID=D3BC67_HETP5|nr:protein phosphatase 2C-related protein [Heterostelium album PN500]EFA81250.1 protein phosphatase 2C-related protein [Heterostelium album PN500]|eukprot:XP_020433368.1 protein phosphatase 2C-related protein [Heterostelium album PN500]
MQSINAINHISKKFHSIVSVDQHSNRYNKIERHSKVILIESDTSGGKSSPTTLEKLSQILGRKKKSTSFLFSGSTSNNSNSSNSIGGGSGSATSHQRTYLTVSTPSLTTTTNGNNNTSGSNGNNNNNNNSAAQSTTNSNTVGSGSGKTILRTLSANSTNQSLSITMSQIHHSSGSNNSNDDRLPSPDGSNKRSIMGAGASITVSTDKGNNNNNNSSKSNNNDQYQNNNNNNNINNTQNAVIQQHSQEYHKTLMAEIQFLERLLQDQITQRNSNTRTLCGSQQSPATGSPASMTPAVGGGGNLSHVKTNAVVGDKEMLIREGEMDGDDIELRRYEDQLKRMIESKKSDLRQHIMQSDKDRPPAQKRSAFLKSGAALSIFPTIMEEKICSSLPLIRIEKPKSKKQLQQLAKQQSKQQQQSSNNNVVDDNNNNNNNNSIDVDQSNQMKYKLNQSESSSTTSTPIGTSTLSSTSTSTPLTPTSIIITTSDENIKSMNSSENNNNGSYQINHRKSNESATEYDLAAVDEFKPIVTLVGPMPDLLEDERKYNDVICCKSGSSYPKHFSGRRQGDPICDRFKVSIYRNNVIATLADGCNWGRLPYEAATKATDAFLQFMEENFHEINTVRKAGSFLLGGMTAAHKGIIAGKSEVWESGTSTLIGGLLTKIKKPKKDHTDFKRMSSLTFIDVEADWVFTGVTLGDCKAFHYSVKNKVFSDITKGNRQNLSDARDPGGRLGPYVGNGEPDLRNLSVFYKYCDENDLILLLSDGVHDNLDPQQLGLKPLDLGIDAESWDIAGQQFAAETDRIKNEYRTQWLSDHFNDEKSLTPSYITNYLLKHCVDTTQTSRDFMEQNTTKKLPCDYKLYPGKMDHNTCICFRVERFYT